MDAQTAKLIAKIAECLPDMPGDVMQGWIENPKALKKVLRTALCFSNIIDCDEDPFVPTSWNIEEHKKSGVLKCDLAKIRLHLSDNQQNGERIDGHNLYKELKNEPVLNANVLDYLLAHPELILEEWKEKEIFFWGTTYRDMYSGLCVRCLYWDGVRWGWSYSYFNHDFLAHHLAACSQVF